MRLVFLISLGLLAACATAPATHPAQPVDGAPYLSPDQAMGGAWCFNPDSPALRQLLKAPKHTPQDPIDALALAEDVQTLHGLMRTQYAGYPALAQARDFDVDAFFADWEQHLRQHGGVISFDEGVLQPLRTLRAVVRDSHLSVWGYGVVLRNEPATRVREYQTILGAHAPPSVESCRVDGRNAFPETLRIAPLISARGPQQVLTVSAKGNAPTVTVHCGPVSYALSPRPQVVRLPSQGPAYSWRPVGDTAVIRLRRLGGTEADLHVLEQLARDYPQHAQFPRIVFDLRGNDGGNDGYVYDWIAQARRGQWFSGADTTLVGPLAPCALWNPLVTMQILDGSVDTAQARLARSQMKSRWQRPPERTVQVFRNGLVDDHAVRPYLGQIDVIVDRDSASSGESAAWVLRSALGAKILGERTAGLFDYGDLRTFVLPRTGIRWNLATKRNWYEAPMESVGVPVDAYLADVGASDEQIVSLLPIR